MKSDGNSSRNINKLTLFVTEACNLKCKYCYVMLPGHCHKAMMSEDCARRIARRVFSHYRSCSFVQFFGGEPTLNMPAIRAFVDEIVCMVREGLLSESPRLGIVTNGASRESHELAVFSKEHNMGLTVSLDGFRHIHDQLRPTANGKGSFDAALTTIESLLRNDVPLAIETVYTSLHIDNGCTMVDLLKFTEALGVGKLILHTAYPPAPAELCPFDDKHFEQLLSAHSDAISYWFETLMSQCHKPLDVYFKDLLVPLLHGTGAAVAGGGCPAGTRDLSMGPSGDTYSCHLLYGRRQFYLGNIITDGELQQEAGLPLSASELPGCAECFARYWCQPCGALNLNWGDVWVPSERECELRRVVVLNIGKLAFKYLAVPQNPITDVLQRTAEEYLLSDER